jgi:hypothetical protein
MFKKYHRKEMKRIIYSIIHTGFSLLDGYPVLPRTKKLKNISKIHIAIGTHSLQ